MMFLLEDQPDVITAMGQTLETLEKEMRSHLNVEDGLVVRSTNGRAESWVQSNSNKPKSNPLRLRPKKKSSARVGVTAEIMKDARELKIPPAIIDDEPKAGALLTNVAIDDVIEDGVECFQVCLNGHFFG